MAIPLVLLPNYRRCHCGHSTDSGPITTEEPYTSAPTDRLLEPGMVLAMKVSCYIRGISGFDIEDVALIVEGGREVLTPKTSRYPWGSQLFPAFLNQMAGRP